MKKIILIAVVLTLMCMSCYASGQPSAESRNDQANREIANTALSSVEIPRAQYFLERETVAAWFKNWDQPGKISYLYIFTQQGCIGYFVINGKPVSNRSYLTPEYTYESRGYVYTNPRQAPALDGTFGEDNAGIRFKTASGVWMEFGGTNFSYIYADRPIPNLTQVNLSPQ